MLPDNDLDAILFWAFRYALGRMSYVVDDLRIYLIKYKNELSKQTKDKIVQEIKKAIASNQAGMQMDVDCWNEVVREFESDSR